MWDLGILTFFTEIGILHSNFAFEIQVQIKGGLCVVFVVVVVFSSVGSLVLSSFFVFCCGSSCHVLLTNEQIQDHIL